MLWGGLGFCNMLCLIRMRENHFYDWVILSCVAFFSIIFMIDSVLYLILASIMLKKGESQSLRKDPRNNEHCVEYFTSKRTPDNA